MSLRRFRLIVGNVMIAFFSALLGWAFNFSVSEVSGWQIFSIIGLIGMGVWLGSWD